MTSTYQRIRRVAVGAAIAAALLYFLIALGVLDIGAPTSGEAPDLVAFGVASGTAFAAIAALLLLAQRRLAWVPIGLFTAMTLVMYFAVAPMRSPPIELNGLLIKALQVVLLLAVTYLVVRGRPRGAQPSRTAARTLHDGTHIPPLPESAP